LKIEKIEDVPVQRELFLPPSGVYLRNCNWRLFAASLYYYPSLLLRLNQITKHFKPEIINVHFPDKQIPAVLWLRQRYSFRLVVSLHGDEVERWFEEAGPSENERQATSDQHRTMTDERRKIQLECRERASLVRLQRLLREAEGVTACSGHLLAKAGVLEPAVKAKGQIIHNGIDPDRFSDRTAYAHPRPYLLAFGRLTHKKGFDLLLSALAQLNNRQPQPDLILAGEGEAEGGLRAQAQALGLAERVHFFGRATLAQVVHLLNGCRGVVIPSRAEPFGIVALEALAAGKPLLVTRVGGLKELIPRLVEQASSSLAADSLRKNPFALPAESEMNDLVFMVEPTVADLRLGLQRLLKRGTCPEQADTIRRYVLGHYSWDQVVRQYESVLAG
jgi:glycosyltransferase involved in cell wall biosynthesis